MKHFFKSIILAMTLSTPMMSAAQGYPDLTPRELAQLDQTARQALSVIQQRSINEQREFCGYILKVTNADGSTYFQAQKPVAGQWAGCTLPNTNDYPSFPVASYHTHSSFGFDADNEVPSVADLQSDIQTQQLGYVSTPGGRFWRSNFPRRAVLMLCDVGCLFNDPNYEDDLSWGPLRKRYSLDELIARQGG